MLQRRWGHWPKQSFQRHFLSVITVCASQHPVILTPPKEKGKKYMELKMNLGKYLFRMLPFAST